MGAVLSCIESVFRTIGSAIMAVISGIGSIIVAIVEGVVALCGIIVSFLTCGYCRGGRTRGGGTGTKRHGFGHRRTARV